MHGSAVGEVSVLATGSLAGTSAVGGGGADSGSDIDNRALRSGIGGDVQAQPSSLAVAVGLANVPGLEHEAYGLDHLRFGRRPC